MWQYVAPLQDMRFVLERVPDAPASWARREAFADIDLDTASAVLEEAARFTSEVVLPTNSPGDLEGCTLDADGAVRTPKGYREAYRALVDGGWPAPPCDPQWAAKACRCWSMPPCAK